MKAKGSPQPAEDVAAPQIVANVERGLWN